MVILESSQCLNKLLWATKSVNQLRNNWYLSMFIRDRLTKTLSALSQCFHHIISDYYRLTMLTSQTLVVSIDLCSAVVLHYYWSQTVKRPSSSCFIVLNRVLLLTKCCFTVWSSGWSTAGRSTVNYASTDLLLHQVSSRGLDVSSIWIYHTAQSVLNKPPRCSSFCINM